MNPNDVVCDGLATPMALPRGGSSEGARMAVADVQKPHAAFDSFHSAKSGESHDRACFAKVPRSQQSGV